MNVNKQNLEVVRAASKDSSRLAIQVLRFEQGGTVATNGNMLATVTYPEQLKGSELPKGLPEGNAEDLTPFSIPADSIKELARSIPKRSCLPALRNAFLDVAGTNSNGSAKFSATDLELTTPTEVRKVDMNFPNCEHVFPKDSDLSDRIGFNPDLLIDALTIVRNVMSEKGRACVVRFGGENTPMLIEGECFETGQVVKVVVMPKRL